MVRLHGPQKNVEFHRKGKTKIIVMVQIECWRKNALMHMYRILLSLHTVGDTCAQKANNDCPKVFRCNKPQISIRLTNEKNRNFFFSQNYKQFHLCWTFQHQENEERRAEKKDHGNEICFFHLLNFICCFSPFLLDVFGLLSAYRHIHIDIV